LTCRGTTFAGRVAASLLNAVGLPELNTKNPWRIQGEALELAQDSDTRGEIRMKLERNRRTYPLFDTDRVRRNLEMAYEEMRTRYPRGEKPSSFSVSID
jgi:predicted O-linked N-acetylglucosamine transferase (SPINDLY family)